MGAQPFVTSGGGGDANEAFNAARDAAGYEYGHGGYSGTIYEKEDFVQVSKQPMSEEDAVALANKMIEEDHPDISDKWGPAGAIPLDTGDWLFFGWASS